MSEAPAAQVTPNGASPDTHAIEETPGFKVFAGNLAYNTTDEGLRAFFAPVQGSIISAQIILRGQRSAGYGFVALSSPEAAEKAVELLDKKELDGRNVIVEVAKPADQKDKDRKTKNIKRRPGRRGGKAVPGEVSEAEAYGDTPKVEDAAPVSGTDEVAKPKKKKKVLRKPKAKGEISDAPSATEELTDAAAPKKQQQPRPRKPKVTRPPRPAGEDPIGDPSKTMLFVANLGFAVDEAGLQALFTEAGIKVVSARIVRRRWGQPKKSKGYGFVEVDDEVEQQKAIAALQGKEVGGRNIAVKVAVNTPREEDAETATGPEVVESGPPA